MPPIKPGLHTPAWLPQLAAHRDVKPRDRERVLFRVTIPRETQKQHGAASRHFYDTRLDPCYNTGATASWQKAEKVLLNTDKLKKGYQMQNCEYS